MVASAVATMVWSSAERNIASIRPSRMRRVAGWSRRAGTAWTAVTMELLKTKKARMRPRHFPFSTWAVCAAGQRAAAQHGHAGGDARIPQRCAKAPKLAQWLTNQGTIVQAFGQ